MLHILKRNWFNVVPTSTKTGGDIIRIVVALIIIMHPLHGMFQPESIPHFGDYLTSLGFSFGLALAWSVLIFQIIASLAMLLKRLVVIACFTHIVILCVGIWFFHAPLGWYVVGPSSGGMEFSGLMIACLFSVALGYWPRKSIV